MRPKYLFAILCIIVPQPVFGQERLFLGPCYSLPKDGTWAEYSWKQTHPVIRHRQGILRISAVGTMQRDGKTLRWLELKLTGRRKTNVIRIRKILIDEAAFQNGKPWKDRIVECWEQIGNQPVVKVAAERSIHFPDLGLENKKQELQLIKKKTLDTRLGKLPVDFYHTRGVHKRMLRHCWISVSDEVPFGLADFELIDLSGIPDYALLLELEITQTGQDAQSELKVTKK